MINVVLLSYISLTILYTSIISPRALRYAIVFVGSLKYFSLSGYDHFFISGIILVALLCTPSIDSIYFTVCGFQIIIA